MRTTRFGRCWAIWLALGVLAGCGSGASNRANAPPVVDGLTAETRTLAPGAQTTLELQATAPDADENATEGLGDLTARWTVDGGGWSIEGDGASATVTAANRYDSRATVRVTVSDGTHATEASLELTTGENRQPRVVGVTVSPRPVDPGGTATLEASASDPRGDELTYTWSSPDAWTLNATSGPSVELTAPDEPNLQAQIDLTVSDAYGSAVRRTVVVRTATNRGPQITSVGANPPQTEPGGKTTISVEASDPNGDSLSYDWTAPNAWTVEGSGRKVDVRAPQRYGISTEIEVEVSDPHGASTTGRAVVSTESNGGPQIHRLSIAKNPVPRSSSADMRIDASDPDGDKLGYRWTTSNRDWSIASTGDTATITAPDEPGSTTRIEVTVTDAGGASARVSRTLSTPPNRVPVVDRIAVNPSVLPPAGTAKVQAKATDPEGDKLSYTWKAPSGWTISGNGATVQLDAPDAYGKRGALRVTVEDSHGGRTAGAATVATERNRPPNVASVTASPPVVGANGTTTLTATASDPNGDSLSYSWSLPKKWKRVGGSGASLKVKGPGTYGQSGQFVVTVADGHGGTTKGAVVVQTRRNRPPVVSTITAGTTVVDPGRSTVLEAIAQDPEGEKLSYKWTVPNPWKHSPIGNGRKTRVDAPKKVSNRVTVVVEVSDPKGAKTTAAIKLRTPDNRSPVIKSLNATPTTNIKPGDTVTLKSSVVDPEGDPITYNWNLPKGWTGGSNSNTVVATAGRQYGQTVQLELRATDGHTVSSKSVGVKLVANKKPTVNSFTVTPNPVQKGKTATAKVDATDPYGDSLSYSWSLASNAWSVKGSGKQVKIQAPNNVTSTTLTMVVDDGHGATIKKTETVKAIKALYNFTSHKFTTCGESGRLGPSHSDCKNAYNTSWDDNTRFFDMDNRGIQEWTVPQSATYEIKVAGAEGGNSNYHNPGKGNVVQLEYNLTQGQTVSIVVGQQGVTGGDRDGGGGGGGTFVVLTDDHSSASKSDIIAIAGGGGGGGRSDNSPEKDGRPGKCGGDGGTHPNSGACNGKGGTSQYNDVGGGGGGGFLGDGQNAGGRNADGGDAFKNGAEGGRSGTQKPGGFGGGGGGSRNCGYGGGGGGYSGGGGGEWNHGCGGTGGGGGSFLNQNGSNRNNDVGENAGDGWVKITRK